MTVKIRFRIHHLLGLLLLASVALWLFTQAGMAKAEIEVVEASGLSHVGPEGSHDNWGNYHATLCVRFHQPDAGLRQMRLFLNTTQPLNQDNLLGRKIAFRYRSKKILWLRPENYFDLAVQKLGLHEADIEERIIEVGVSD